MDNVFDRIVQKAEKQAETLRDKIPHLNKETESECIERNIQILMSK